MSGELGKSSLDLEANLTRFEANVDRAGHSAEGLDRQLGALAAIANVAEKALNDVGISPTKAAESRVSAEAILTGVRGISDESRDAARELDHVKITEAQAAESEVAGGMIDRILNSISRNADQAKRKLLEVKLAGGVPGRSGVGVGPFGSGFGRIGVLGAAVGVGAIAAPAAAPAAVGLLAAIPGLAFAAAGALGVLALAGHGVAKAIGGDAKAFKDLPPAAQKFVLQVRSLDGWLDKLRQTAAKGLFPGLTAGLHSALSPGTVGVITMAVTALSVALGHAGAEWGQFFGSPEFQHIFGPLMLSAARNIGVLSNTALHLFDALGVLARAAIPFTNWLVDAADKGAKLFDSWIHAKNASGQLAHGMDEARVSLTLVAKLFGALLGAAFALGQALYPIAKVAVKALTDGLHGLSGVIHRNEGDIRGIVGGALRGFIAVVKLAASGVGVLWHGLEGLIGHKGMIIAGITAIGVAITLSLGPASAAILGALVAVGLIKKHWGAIARFFGALGHEIVQGFKYVWYLIEKGALKAALRVVGPFSHLPGALGGWARRAKNSMQFELSRLHPPNMDWSGVAARDGAMTGKAWAQAFDAAAAKNRKALRDHILNMPPNSFDFWLRQHPGGTHKEYEAYVKAFKLTQQIGKDLDRKRHHKRHHHHDPKPGTHAWYMQNLGYDPTQGGSGDVFGKPPPFTKNTGSGSRGGSSAQPQGALNLEALARRQDQEAAALGYAGKKAREHLNKEIADLQAADRLLEEKLKHAHGHRRTEIYNAITANEKKIAEARKRLHDAAGKARQIQLSLALDQAKLAVENAQQGSKAYDRAVAAEEKALRAEIRYWAKREHNMKLSTAARDAALRKELSYQKQLKALLNQTAQAANANEAQFLSSFLDIQNTFAPNAVPYQDPSGGGNGQTDTHLHEIKQEARQTNRHLKALRNRNRFRHSHHSHDAAAAVGA